MIWRLILAIVLLGVIVGGIVGFNLFRDKMIAGYFAGMQPPPVTVSTTTVEPVTWKPGIDAIGTARAAQGVFGAPFIVVDGEPFWGQDRLPMVEAWLREGPW